MTLTIRKTRTKRTVNTKEKASIYNDGLAEGAEFIKKGFDIEDLPFIDEDAFESEKHPFHNLCIQLKKDNSYALSWFHNISQSIQSNGISYNSANKISANLMARIFQVNIEKQIGK